MTVYPITWNYDDEDIASIERDAAPLPSLASDVFATPEEIDPRGWYQREDQGSLGSCQGFALTGAGEFAYRVATGSVIQFSPMWAFVESQRRGNLLGNSMNGSRLTDGLWVAKTLGLAPESAWPYTGRYTTTRPPGVIEAAAPYKIRSHSVCRTYFDIFNYLAGNVGGVWIGCDAAAFRPTSPGLLGRFQRGGGGHSTCFLGFSRRISSGRHWLWMWNSGYPTPGWYETSPEWIDVMLQQRNSVCLGISDMTTPEPRKFRPGKDRFDA